MGGNQPAKSATRLKDQQQREPLPTPMPPPPRATKAPVQWNSAPQAVSMHTVPPQPHFGTRFPKIEPRDLQATSQAEEIPERSLASFRVVMALVLSALLMGAIAYLQSNGPDGLSLNSWKGAIRRGASDDALPEEELPYITSMPITPSYAAKEPVAKSEGDRSAGVEQVMLSDLLGDEPDASETQRPQRR